MIDLTPLDVRNKRGDFKKILRGYDPQEVDIFLEVAAERLEVLVRENLQLRDRTQTLQNQVDAQVGRERAVQDALVTAQELRADMQTQSQREADHVLKEAEVEARRLLGEADEEVRSRLRGAERRLDQGEDALDDLERRRARFLKEFKGLLERELDVVQVEEGRAPLEERAIDMDIGAGRSTRSVVDNADAAGSDEAAEGESDVETDLYAETDSVSDAVDDVSPALEEEAPEAGAEEDQDNAGPDDSTAPDTVDESIETPIDVSDLEPSRSVAPPAEVGSEPSSLELELMASASGSEAVAREVKSDRFPDVPDLETVLAEAGMDDDSSPLRNEIAPPPAPGVHHDNLILFDPNDKDSKR